MTALPVETDPRTASAAEAAMWAAVLARDPDAEGRFVYGVVTTGVYCRPTCPSRRPLRANVRFFADGAEAEATGLRPCKRCRPTESPPAERRRSEEHTSELQ